MVYVAVVSVFAFVLPRLERSYLASLTIDVSLSAAVTFFSTVASGVMALTAMVFTIAFVMVQFSTVAYSPRLVAMFVEDPRLYHTLGSSSRPSPTRCRRSCGRIAPAREPCRCSRQWRWRC